MTPAPKKQNSENIRVRLDMMKKYPFKDPENLRLRLIVRQIPSPPSTVQRETYIIPVDPIGQIDMFRDIVVGHKRPT
jgi:hypothetical protein